MNQTEQAPINWELLVNALRNELEEYGGLLSLLKEQQQLIFNREPDLLRDLSLNLEKQLTTARTVRSTRENLVRRLLQQEGVDVEFQALSEVVTFFPHAMQGMITALIEEINRLIQRTRQKLKQNQLLLSRASDVVESVIRTVQPQSLKTYNRRGGTAFKTAASQGSRIRATV